MTRRLTVVYDACVLYPAPLRDLLMHLAVANAVDARWTDRIHDEWIRNVHANRPDLSLMQLHRTRRLMDANVHDSLVKGYENRIEELTLPDPDDRHVLAAAIHAAASVIVTYNRSDFPNSVLSPYEIESLHPDDFVCRLLDSNLQAVCVAVASQRALLKNPPYSVDELLETLEKQKLSKTVARLREYADRL